MIFRKISRPELIYVFGIIVFLLWLILTARELKKRTDNVYTSYADILSVLVLISAVLLLLHFTHFTDVVFFENGFNIRNSNLTETIFHLGLVNNLTDMFPPLYPYASGVDYSHYHLNMHLEIEMFNRLFSIDTIKLTFFYFPFLYFSLLVFMPYMFIRVYWDRKFIGVLTGLLMFGSGLSFIPGLLGGYPVNYPWTSIFTTTIWSFFTLNGLLPATFILFLSVFYLKKYYEAGRLSHLVIFGILCFTVFGFKSSMGLHIIGIAFLTGIVSAFFMKDSNRGKFVCVVSILVLLVMYIDIVYLRGGTGQYIIRLDLFNQFQRSLKNLGYSDIAWVFYPVAFPLYLLAVFGIRIIGFYFLKDVFKKKYFDPIVFFLLIFGISGFFLSETIYLGTRYYTANDGIFFSVQSLLGTWLLLSYFLLKYRGRKFIVYTCIVVILSVATTAQFLILRFDQSYVNVSANAIEVVKHLESTPSKSIILHPLNLDRPSLSSHLAGRQSVISIFRSGVLLVIGEEDDITRTVYTNLFFNSNDAKKRSYILNKYKVNYVYAPSKYSQQLDGDPMLNRVLKNSEYVLYKVKNKQ